jgi:hypothetical protein
MGFLDTAVAAGKPHSPSEFLARRSLGDNPDFHLGEQFVPARKKQCKNKSLRRGASLQRLWQKLVGFDS